MKLTDKENRAIGFIKKIPLENTQIAFSGGKDSIVLYYLCKLAGIDVPIIYGNTTIDPKGTIKMIKDHYSDVQILQPKKSFYQLVAEKGLPTRVGRFCCEHLKESYGIGKNNIEGIRSEEGSRRAKYEPEQCDSRKWMRGAKHYYPILDFTEKEVWEIINSNGLKTLPYYHHPYNWKRHGCVGCPLSSSGRQQIVEYKAHPRYARALIKSIEKNLTKRNQLGKNFTDPHEVFWWWISRRPLKQWIAERNQLFKTDYKERFNEILPL